MKTTPEELIEKIRNSFEGSVEVYTQGSCYQFYLILKCVFPEAIAYYDSNHVITKIGDDFFDINGRVELENHIPIEEHYSHYTIRQLKEGKYDIKKQ